MHTHPGPAALARLFVFSSVLAACGQPDGLETVETASGALIVDQVHSDGKDGFFFLPPLVPRPGNFGEQVQGLWPVVVIDQVNEEGVFLGSIATFTKTDGPFHERLRRHLSNGPQVDDDGDTDPNGYFVARWKTGRVDAPAGTYFRIRVLAEGHQLGVADVQVVGNKKDLKNVDRAVMVPLLVDQTLRIKFRIGREAVDRDADGVFDWSDNCPTVVNPDQADSVGNGVGNACRCPDSADACPVSARLYALQGGNLPDPVPSAIEIVDLGSMARVHSIAIGNRTVTSLAVTPDGHRAYVADWWDGEIASYDTVSNLLLATIPLPGVYDLAMSPGGERLFAVAGEAIVAIETATNTIVQQHAEPLGVYAYSLTLSPDGHTLGVVTSNGGSDPRYSLFDTQGGLSLLAEIPIEGNVEGCTTFPNDSVFAGNDRAVLWDNNCDVLYQVDVPTRAQLPLNANTGRDDGGFENANNAITFAGGRTFNVKESGKVIVGDPSTGSFVAIGGFVDLPYVIASAGPNGPVLIRNGDALDLVDATTLALTRQAYMFSGVGPRDMVVVHP